MLNNFKYPKLNLNKEEIVKPGKNSIFLKKGKTVISIENRKFSISQTMKWTSPLSSSREI